MVTTAVGMVYSDLKPILDYFERNFSQPSPLYLEAIGKGYIGDGDTIYDIGCGWGGQFRQIYYSKNIKELTGVDASDILIKQAKQQIDDFGMDDKVFAYEMDCLNLREPLKTEGADKVLAFDILGCQNKVSCSRILDELVRVCKHQGKIILSVPAQEFYLSRVQSGIGGQKLSDLKKCLLRNPDAEEIEGSVFSEEGIRRDLETRGCAVEAIPLAYRYSPYNVREYPKDVMDSAISILAIATKK
jgi:SAM-dependent methyltransferase